MKCVLNEECSIKKELTCCFECNKLNECKYEGRICINKSCDYYGKHIEEKQSFPYNYDPYDLEKWFIDGIDKLKNPNSSLDILNWYRNLYYKFNKNTERGRVAWAINDLFMLLKKNNIDLNSLESGTNDKQSQKWLV